MRVRFSRPAERDLEEIGDYIAADSPAAAEKVLRGLREAGSSLTAHPRRYPRVSQLPSDEIRKVSRGNYLLFYRVAAEEIEIVRVVHAATDWVRLFA